MKEFIEKLIARLEEHSFSLVINWEKGKYLRKDKAIQIINDLAEEYKGDWIPCENKLPDTSEWHPSVVAKEFLVTYYPDEVTKPWVGIRYFRKDANVFLTKKEEKVIAWQPLPAPYNPKGE